MGNDIDLGLSKMRIEWIHGWLYRSNVSYIF